MPNTYFPKRVLLCCGTLVVPCLVAGQFPTVPATAPTSNTDATSSTISADAYRDNLLVEDRRTVVTNQAMGARCAVAADFDGDGRMDLVSASSNDNAVSWFRNEGPAVLAEMEEMAGSGSSSGAGSTGSNALLPTFSIKKKITWSSLGSRIVTVADIDSDGDVDVVGASYYDSSLRWYENDGTGEFREHIVSTAVNEGQGVTVADVDNDGDADIVSASSGDNTIAVFRNLDGKGSFCEIKEVVDDNAVGARTAVAADLNGDGWVDIISASKDDDTVAWYPNDGTGRFPTKLIVSRGELSKGAYSLVAEDIDGDGDQDLIVASNGNDSVTLWRNDGKGNFTRTLIYGNADFVLSVTAVDFDRDGDMDVASASFFDGHINWYENVDGEGRVWQNRTIYVGVQGHYVSHGDMDGDGDDDLIAVTHAENTVAVYYAATGCDFNDGSGSVVAGAEAVASAVEAKPQQQQCCPLGTEWNGATEVCDQCPQGQYGTGTVGAGAQCSACPSDACIIPGLNVLPATCSGITGCSDVYASMAECSCPADTVRDTKTDACTACPEGQVRPILEYERTIDTLGNYSNYEMEQGVCAVYREDSNAGTSALIGVIVALVVIAIAALFAARHLKKKGKKVDDVWRVLPSELTFDDPPEILGRGTFGLVVLAEYRGTEVAVKRVIPPKSRAAVTDSMIVKTPLNLILRRRSSMHGDGDSVPTTLRRSSSIGDGSQTNGCSSQTNGVGGLRRTSDTSIPEETEVVELAEDPAQRRGSLGRRGSEGSGRSSTSGTGSVKLRRLSIGATSSANLSESIFEESANSNDFFPAAGDDKEKNAVIDLDYDPEAGNKTIALRKSSVTNYPGRSSISSASAAASQKGVALSFFEAYSKESNMACDEITRARLQKEFVKEMRHLSKLRHPCITTVMGAVIEPNSEPALVMEYMDRGSLHDLLHNESVSLDGDVLLPILQDICMGLRFLHSADPQVIHGDLKSANVLVDSKSRAKIADFGLTQKKQMGVAGTPYWMAPELLRGESQNTSASDVYSFGIILYEVYSRRDPYEGESFKMVIKEICDPNVNKRPPTPSACPDTIGVLMRECLDGEALARPSAEELDLRLKRERVENIEPGDMHLTVQTKKTERSLKRAESFIYKMFPKHIADALREGKKVEPEHHDCVTVFFSDIVNFTQISEELGHKKVAYMLDRLYKVFDELSEKHDVFKIEVIGDAYLAVTNLVQDQKNDHVKRIAEFSIDAVRASGNVLLDEDDPSKGAVQIRIGFHSGPVIADILGTRLPKYSIFGDTVNTASRMESSSKPNRIHCSSISASMLLTQAPHIRQTSRGNIKIKGKGEMHTYWINEKIQDVDIDHKRNGTL